MREDYSPFERALMKLTTKPSFYPHIQLSQGLVVFSRAFGGKTHVEERKVLDLFGKRLGLDYNDGADRMVLDGIINSIPIDKTYEFEKPGLLWGSSNYTLEVTQLPTTSLKEEVKYRFEVRTA